MTQNAGNARIVRRPVFIERCLDTALDCGVQYEVSFGRCHRGVFRGVDSESSANWLIEEFAKHEAELIGINEHDIIRVQMNKSGAHQLARELFSTICAGLYGVERWDIDIIHGNEATYNGILQALTDCASDGISPPSQTTVVRRLIQTTPPTFTPHEAPSKELERQRSTD